MTKSLIGRLRRRDKAVKKGEAKLKAVAQLLVLAAKEKKDVVKLTPTGQKLVVKVSPDQQRGIDKAKKQMPSLKEKVRLSTTKKVAVIGGGFAGLSAAFELDQSNAADHVNYEVTVFEARDRVGGRVYSATKSDFIEDESKWAEVGGELIGRNFFYWQAYAERFGLQFIKCEDPSFSKIARLTAQQQNQLNVLNDITDRLDKLSDQVFQGNEDKEVWEIPDAKILDSMSLEDWMKKEGFSGEALELMKYEIENNNGALLSQQSLLFMLANINAGRKEGMSFWEDTENYRCFGGNGSLAKEFEKRLQDKIVYGHAVLKIDLHYGPEDKVAIYTRKQGQSSAELYGVFDEVVLAVPPSLWKDNAPVSRTSFVQDNWIDIVPDMKIPKQIQMGNLAKLLFQINRRFWRDLDMTSDQEFNCAMTWETTNRQGPNAPYCFVIFTADISGELRVSKDPVGYITQRFQKEIEDIKEDPNKSPEEKNQKISYITEMIKELGNPKTLFKFANWPGEQYTQCGYSIPNVGEITTDGEFLHTPYQGKLYFAGEHACHYRWNGFMEGALESGVSVANDIIAKDLTGKIGKQEVK